MDSTAVRALFDQQIRQNARPDGPGTRIEHSGGVVRQVGPVNAWNGILWWDQALAGAAADAAITAQAQHFAALGVDCEWKLYSHDQPADLPDRLLAAGFAAGDPETLMVAPVEGPAQAGDLPEGVTLRPVADAADREGAELMAEVHWQAFGSHGARISERMLSQLAADPDSVVAVVAMAGDRPVSSARLEFVPGTDFAGLWGGGTVPEWRGRGIYRALIAHRARIAAARGYRYLQVDASDQSRPILQRLGFTALGTTTPYLRTA